MRPDMTKLLVLSTLILTVLAAIAAGCGGTEKETLVIAVQPSATQEELSTQARELEEFLEDRVAADIELRFPTTYAGVIEALRFGHADAAFMSAWPASLASKHAGADVVLAEIRDVTIGDDKVQEPYYFSYWIVPKDSPYRSIEELEGKNVAFPSQLSTSGYVAPVARLVQLGLIEAAAEDQANPDDYFGNVLFAGGYSQAWEALKAGQVDVTVIAGDVPEDLYRDVLDNTKVLEEQGPIPSHAVVFSKDLMDPLRGDLREALMDLGADEHRELMRKFVSGIFVRFQVTTTEEHLGSLNSFLSDTGLAFTERLQ